MVRVDLIKKNQLNSTQLRLLCCRVLDTAGLHFFSYEVTTCSRQRAFQTYQDRHFFALKGRAISYGRREGEEGNVGR